MTDPFDFAPPPELFAVMGNPVSHSKSPQIHQQFAAQFGLRIEYQRIQVDVGGFPQAVSNFQAAGGRGLNVTVPFKMEAFALADEVSPRAALAGAVNTLSFGTAGAVRGDNTDGLGLWRDITVNLATPVRDRRVLLLGAGGAARGVLGPLLDDLPRCLTVANRTVDKAVALAELFSQHGPVSACGFAELAGQQFDLVINGTAAGLDGTVPALPPALFATGALAYDMIYGDEHTAFLVWAQVNGATRTADGIGMLVEQAAESFALWHGRRPATGEVIKTLGRY